MKKLIPIFFLCFVFLNLQSQNKKKKGVQTAFLPSVEYSFQRKHCMGAWAVLAMAPNKHPHTFIMPNIGGNIYWFGKTAYFSPGISCELYDQIDKTHKRIGFYARAGFTNYRVGDLKNNALYGDIGVSTFYFHFFAGYNYFLNKTEVNPVSPFRIGIKFL